MRRQRRLRRGAVILAAATVTASFAAVRSGTGDGLDRAARDALARPLGARSDLAIGAITDLGSIYGLVGITAALATTGRRHAAVDVAGAGTVAWVVAQGLKPTLDRPRPYQLDAAERLVAVPVGSSWPSGHTSVAGATAAALGPHLGPVGRSVAAGYVATVGLSRLYVGVHHLTDIAAGAGVGVLSAALARAVHRSVERRCR